MNDAFFYGNFSANNYNERYLWNIIMKLFLFRVNAYMEETEYKTEFGQLKYLPIVVSKNNSTSL